MKTVENKNEVMKFLKEHRDLEISAAKLLYFKFLRPEMEAETLKALNAVNSSEEDVRAEQEIRLAEGPALIPYMRKRLSGINLQLLRGKMMENQAEIAEEIKCKLLTNKQDYFIENAIYFLLYCEDNPGEWISLHYDELESEYAKSMLCLVLGLRENPDKIPFLISEAKRFEKYYPNEGFDQGPAIAVGHMVNG